MHHSPLFVHTILPLPFAHPLYNVLFLIQLQPVSHSPSAFLSIYHSCFSHRAFLLFSPSSFLNIIEHVLPLGFLQFYLDPLFLFFISKMLSNTLSIYLEKCNGFHALNIYVTMSFIGVSNKYATWRHKGDDAGNLSKKNQIA